MEQEKTKTDRFWNFYDKNYKRLLLIPIILLIFSFAYVGYFYTQTGDFFYKDISLTGGTTVTIYDNIDKGVLENEVSDDLENLNTRYIYDLVTNEKKAIIIETTTGTNKTKSTLEDFLDYKLDSENSSFQFTGSTLSQSFFRQLLMAIVFAFIFMAIVVFIIFRIFIPSAAVIISAFADIFMSLTLVNLLGIELSTAGIVAFLMLIGYSVDTDILLTTRVLKRREGSINERIARSFKTGITMTLTSVLAFTLALIVVQSFSVVLSQIFTILIIGLGFDILNTWITNTSIIKWYAESRK